MTTFNMRGADISNWNTNPNYANMKANGCQIVHIKATEGTTYTDPRLSQHYNGCKNAGMKIGFYHYLRESSAPETQAQNFLNKIKDKQNDVVPMLDVEENWNGMSNCVIRFIKKWKSITNMPLGIYTYSGFMGHFTQECRDVIKDMPCWIANYRNDYAGVKTGFFTNIVGWQNADNGTFGSYKGDTSYYNNGVLIGGNNKVSEPTTPPNDTVIEDCFIFANSDGTEAVGSLNKGDRVTVLDYYSDYTRLKSNDTFVYIETKKLESHAPKEAEKPPEEETPPQEIKVELKDLMTKEEVIEYCNWYVDTLINKLTEKLEEYRKNI